MCLQSWQAVVSQSGEEHFYTNSKILYSCKYNNPNQLLILEALLIKRKLPELNCGLKASKQLSLFL